MTGPEDTIVAIASASGAGARGIVRISGPRTVEIVQALLAAGEPTIPAAAHRRVAWHGCLSLSHLAVRLPADCYLWPTSRSYTRQPLAEIHTLGSLPLLEGIVQAACTAGARLARPGEFTLRAFLAGRIDLTQAEAVLGVIDADDAQELQTALQQLAGGLGSPLLALRGQLLDLLADLEAGMDFVNEDIAFVSTQEVRTRLTEAADHAERLRLQLESRKTASSFPRVVLWGPPNVGKSSLFNVLTRSTAAVVHCQAGTTRDYVSCICPIETIQVELMDTAGMSQTPQSAIDDAAQEQTRAIAEQADLLLWCDDGISRTYSSGDDPLLAPSTSRTIFVRTKSDLPGAAGAAFAGACYGPGVLACSAHTQVGIRALCAEISRRLARAGRAEWVASTAARCRDSLRRVLDALDRAVDLARSSAGEELIAAELRLALQALGEMVGMVYTDDILDRIFSRFCIGK